MWWVVLAPIDLGEELQELKADVPALATQDYRLGLSKKWKTNGKASGLEVETACSDTSFEPTVEESME